MIVMPGSAPSGDLADRHSAAGFRIENLQRGGIHAKVTVGLETIDTHRVVKGMEALGHLIAVGWNHKIALLLDPIVRQILPVDAFLFTETFVVEPQADFNHDVLNHFAPSSRTDATWEIMNIPLNLRAVRQGPTDIVRNFLAPFAHGIFGEHSISAELAVFIFDKDN